MSLNELATLCAVLTTVSATGYFIYKEYRKRVLKYRKKLQGYWTNEGDVVLSKNETHFITLCLQTDIEDGEITGLINSTEKRTDNDILHVSVNGKLKYNRAKINFSDIKHGHVIDFGKAKIKVIGIGKRIQFKMIRDYNNFFPRTTIVWRVPYTKVNNMP